MLLRRTGPSLRRVVITGASRGIGMAFARALPEADLLLTGRDTDALNSLAAELRESGGSSREVTVVPADLVDAEGLATLIKAAEAFAPDGLINDAGLGTYGGFLEDPPPRQEATVLVNVLAPVILSRALLPGMLERAEAQGHRAALVNLASTLAFTPVPYGAIYGASKAFVLSFTEALAAELAGRPVDVLAVCPGPVNTAFFGRAGFPGGAPLGAYQPEQVARRAIADLGRLTVTFSDVPSALLLRPIADMRVGLARTLALGMGAVRAWTGRWAPEPEPQTSVSGDTADEEQPAAPRRQPPRRSRTGRRAAGSSSS